MKSSLTNFVLAVLLLAFAGGGYTWWYRAVAAESSAVARLSQEIDAKNEAAERTSAVEEALARLAESRGAVEDYFISESNIVAFLEELETIGTGIGAGVHVVSVGVPAGQGIQTLPVSLALEGSFDAVVRTIGAIEKSPYSVSISTASLRRGGGDGSLTWNATVGIAVGSMFSSQKAPGSAPAANSSPR